MYFSSDDICGLWKACANGGVSKPVLIKQPFAKPIATDAELLAIMKAWAAAGRRGKASVADISYIDSRALPESDDASMDACIQRIQAAWPGDWFAYVNDVHQYDGAIWERAVEVLLPAVRRNGGLPAGGFRIEGFFGKYGSTPTGIHLDSSDNFSFIVRGPKRLVFWPRDRFQPLVQFPDARAPAQELALTRRYEDHLADAIVLDGEVGDVIYWPRDYWHVGASPEGWTAMINLAMWWNARPITLARFVLNRVLDLDGDARLHPFNPSTVLQAVATPPATLSQPVRDAVTQIVADVDSTARIVWASVATSYGFTSPPARAPIPELSDETRLRVKHPIVPLLTDRACMVAACGRQTRTAVPITDAGCALLNAAPGAEYPARMLAEILTGRDLNDGMRDECTRIVGELIAFRALEVVS
jgi:hypothetical protein